MEQRNLDEKIFCYYCKMSLLGDKERHQGYHDNCINEFTFSQDFNFLEINDKQILNQIITQFKVQGISIYEQSVISFSGFEQIEEWDAPPLLEIILGNGKEVSEGKTLMKIQSVKLHHFSNYCSFDFLSI